MLIPVVTETCSNHFPLLLSSFQVGTTLRFHPDERHGTRVVYEIEQIYPTNTQEPLYLMESQPLFTVTMTLSRPFMSRRMVNSRLVLGVRPLDQDHVVRAVFMHSGVGMRVCHKERLLLDRFTPATRTWSPALCDSRHMQIFLVALVRKIGLKLPFTAGVCIYVNDGAHSQT